MTPQQVFTVGQEGLWLLLSVAAPVLLAVLVVGLVVSVLQAATQISEATLSFVPKVVAAVAVLAFAGPWMTTTLVEYLQRTLLAIPGVDRVISFTEAEVLGWITPLLWPFLRALALLAALPLLGTRTVPTRVRIGLAALIALAAQASLPAMPVVALDSPLAFLLVVQQLLIGLSLGFAVRLVFAAIEMAGEIVGLQMGLNFAGFFDPVSASQTTASSRFFGAMVGWLFVVINGHLLVIAALVASFGSFPVGAEPFAFVREARPHEWGATIFATALGIALPMVAILLFVNLVLGVISRVAAQINIFAVGFPVTLGVGLLGILLTLPLLQQPFTLALERMLAYF